MEEEATLTLEAVFDAYFECRKNKRNSLNQLRFEADLEGNLVTLYRDIQSGAYEIGRSLAFVVTHPKIREIWASDFRDRVVHHLIYSAIRNRFSKRFIRDSYACIPGRGTHDGLRRISGFARAITRNGTRPAYVLQVDVANFFNSIDKRILWDVLERCIPEPWLRRLVRQVINHDPRENVVRRSSRDLFRRVPQHKSLYHAPDGKGLPIGNLTSQFFANVYMNELDQFAKHHLKARHYGRYVDDMILFHTEPYVLNEWCERIDSFLQSHLALRLHPRKVSVNRVSRGINFVGFIIKPGRTYLRRYSLARCKQKVRAWERKGAPVDEESLAGLSASLNSYLGMLRQIDGYKARRDLCGRVENLFLKADAECTKILPAVGKQGVNIRGTRPQRAA